MQGGARVRDRVAVSPQLAGAERERARIRAGLDVREEILHAADRDHGGLDCGERHVLAERAERLVEQRRERRICAADALARRGAQRSERALAGQHVVERAPDRGGFLCRSRRMAHGHRNEPGGIGFARRHVAQGAHELGLRVARAERRADRRELLRIGPARRGDRGIEHPGAQVADGLQDAARTFAFTLHRRRPSDPSASLRTEPPTATRSPSRR